MLEIIFWSAFAVVFYTYAGYPLLVDGVSRLRGAAGAALRHL